MNIESKLVAHPDNYRVLNTLLFSLRKVAQQKTPDHWYYLLFRRSDAMLDMIVLTPMENSYPRMCVEYPDHYCLSMYDTQYDLECFLDSFVE
jgi:hypothetical protein